VTCHNKIHSEFFATPPRLVAFAIQAPALRTAVGQFSPLDDETTLALL